MSTNFYLDKQRKKHIGKRSAAGLYCWDCNISLCKKGADYVHHWTKKEDWYKSCPKCGKSYEIGNKLGKGVSPCTSFTWAIKREDISKRKRFIYDSNGKKWTIKEFNKMVNECPIQFTHYIGQNFS